MNKAIYYVLLLLFLASCGGDGSDSNAGGSQQAPSGSLYGTATFGTDTY